VAPASDDHTTLAVVAAKLDALTAELRLLAQTTVSKDVCNEREKARDASSNSRWQLFSGIVGVAGFLTAVVSVIAQFQ
jgi:hypothetical protein